MNYRKLIAGGLGLLIGVAPAALKGETPTDNFGIDYSAEAFLAAGSGDFAPYYIMSNRHGVLTQSKDALLDLKLTHDWDSSRRFSYGFGAEVIGGYSSSTDYMRYQGGDFVGHAEHPANIWLQQLYGQVRFRGVFLTVGLKEYSSAFVNNSLASGDLVESGNSRPIPQVRIGFNDFQDIPFTRGWLQIQGEISYGKMTDNSWLKNHYNYYNSHINEGALYTYKRCWFRTNPSQPLSATFGMQVGAFFGGTTYYYENGKLVSSSKLSRNVKQFFKMFIPTDGGLEYYTGSTLGSWDVKFRYRLRNGAEVSAYLQKPWEDGSGIGFLNGFDGVWGLEYKSSRPGLINGVVAEYLDFTNQSGPFHWDPDDNPGTTIHNRAEGNDNYYNNHQFNSYANYGMAIGNPFLVSPIYNTDGYIRFAANRVRGFHIGVEGVITPELSYKLKGGYRRSWGNGDIPFIIPKDDTSFMIEAVYTPASLPAWRFKGAFALDHGTLLGNNTGGLLTVAYSGNFSFKR